VPTIPQNVYIQSARSDQPAVNLSGSGLVVTQDPETGQLQGTISGGGGGGDGPFNTHWVWVSTSGGDDATGDGTVNKPFASIAAANASITDNSSDNHYVVLIAPGTYVADGLVLKSWVDYVGLSQFGTVISVDSVGYDPGYDSSGSAPTSIQSCVLSTDPVLTGSAAIHNPLFADVILQDGLTLSGAASFSPSGCVIAALGATITDVFSVFSRDNSWEGVGGVTFQSQTLDDAATWDVTGDRYLFGVTVSQSSGHAIDFRGDGYLLGAITLDTTLATFGGTLTFCGTSLVLTGGALETQYSIVGGGNGTAGSVPSASGSGQVFWSSVGTSGALVGGLSGAISANITAASRFFFTLVTPGGTPGQPYAASVTPGNPGSFKIQSTSALDTSTYNYMVLG
jgi:hypothetical protein